MKFSCQKDDILRALSVAQKATSNTSTLPILENILFVAEGKKVELSSTNLEISIRVSFEAKIFHEGKVALPAKTITTWISLSTDEEIVFSQKEINDVLLQTKTSKTTLKGFSVDDFPALPIVSRKNWANVSQKNLKEALDEVIFSAAGSSARPVLSGIYFCREGEKLVLVGTDSYRLSEKKIPFSFLPEEEVSCIVPAKTLSELDRILVSNDEDEVEILFSKNQIAFLFSGVQLISRLIDGQFPNYKQIIPTSFQETVRIDRLLFIQNIKRVMIFARENNNTIRLSFCGGSLEITTDATEIGKEESHVVISGVKKNLTLSLNSQFLLDVLMTLSGTEIFLDLGERLAPVLLRSEKNTDFLHIIMPLKM